MNYSILKLMWWQLSGSSRTPDVLGCPALVYIASLHFILLAELCDRSCEGITGIELGLCTKTKEQIFNRRIIRFRKNMYILNVLSKVSNITLRNF